MSTEKLKEDGIQYLIAHIVETPQGANIVTEYFIGDSAYEKAIDLAKRQALLYNCNIYVAKVLGVMCPRAEWESFGDEA